MNQKGSAYIIVIVALLIVVAVLGYLLVIKKPIIQDQVSQEETTPILTEDAAHALVISTWGGCTPDSCGSVTVSVQNNNGSPVVTALYEGLRDDSSSAQKKVAPAYYSNNVWALGEAVITQRCQPGRGHQDFSAEFCI